MSSATPEPCSTLRWIGDVAGRLRLIDQTRLPVQLAEIECTDPESVWKAIRTLQVRGAPAIGVAAAYGLVLGVQPALDSDRSGFLELLERTASYLATSRPTAVNLFWALARMERVAFGSDARLPTRELAERLLAEAHAIRAEDIATCQAIGRHGATLLQEGQGVLTHCNAGGLATAEYGTALAVFFAAQESGKRLHVYADETRPLLQGSRLTAWELQRRGIEVTVICDSAAAQVMREGKVQAVVVGADRIAANGDVANKIGTYGVAVLAKAHGIPFYVAAPTSTFDLTLDCGQRIPIEHRPAEEITHGFGQPTAPAGVAAYNPAFDVTPADLIAALICEHGIISPPNSGTIAALISPNSREA